MADSDYTLAVVLQASDEGMSSGIKNAADGIEDAGNKAQQAKIDFMALMVGLEGLTSGLNQLTGGMRKMTAAMTQTGMATEDQTKKLNEQIAMMELFTGPMESIIAIVKLSTVIHAAYTGLVAVETGVVISATVANYGLAASMAIVSVGLIGLLAVGYLFVLLLLDTEKGLETVEAALDKTAAGLRVILDILIAIRDAGKGVVDGIGGFFDNAQGPGGSLMSQDGSLVTMGGGSLA
tara:strand:- start:5315 stop:6022 length:708 start_codon:yes stop_codon:yes gene_type:complete